MPLVLGSVVLIYAFFPLSHSTNMFPNAVTTWKNMETPKKVFMTTFGRVHRRPPSSTTWNLTWFLTWLLTWGLVPGPIPFNCIINLVAFTFQPSPPGTSHFISCFWLPWPSLSLTCLWPALTISVDYKNVWCMRVWAPIIIIIIKAFSNSWSREKSRQEKSCPTSKHLRVSCHVSSGKLEEILVLFHLAGEPIKRERDTHSYTTLSNQQTHRYMPQLIVHKWVSRVLALFIVSILNHLFWPIVLLIVIVMANNCW